MSEESKQTQSQQNPLAQAPPANMPQTDAEQLRYIYELLMPEQFAIAQNARYILTILLGWMSVTVEVFLRKDFGERYLNWLRLWLGGWMLFFYAFFTMTTGNNAVGAWLLFTLI